ncbi:MAG: hypothetical protein Ta2B_07970 [Termitinemataceae bacterium]|nr:MAG: hypothetical protein Ta2B_07970 [Termitinemataceae bacterium]
MARFEKNNNSHGSLKDLQILINEKSHLINNELKKHLNKKIDIKWVSPIKDDNFSEYRDADFLNLLGINNNLKIPLNEFWPKNGPQWDALGNDNDTIFIVEAKANIPELKSPETKASGDSKILINKSLDSVKEYLNIDKNVNWTSTYYQYTNRIAHLYYLRVINNIKTYLIFIYFINDNSVNGPKTIEEWKHEINNLHKDIGLVNDNKLSEYIIDVFIDCNNLK